ncbi:MAG: exodeoxyribonuclease VII large subunit [Clostridiales bacterium]|nr:exodeoxyribonuclease VII large subunit [Clostridiales bacterium]
MSFRLNVPYSEKDEAKAFGARWNPAEKYWYCEQLNEGLRRWYEGDEEAPAPSADPADLMEGYLSVTSASSAIASAVAADEVLRNIKVQGEVTNFSGHTQNYYFSVKDTQSIIDCFMFEHIAAAALDFELENGKQVAISGYMNFHEKSGKFKLLVRGIVDAGEGDEKRKLMELKEKLRAEGLFDEERKKPISKHPSRVGIVTSKSGQAIRDICKIASKRNPYVQLVLYHVNVQGRNAVPTIVEGIRYLDAQNCDTLIVGRGGGSDEELKAYNDESIARAVADAVTPVISAVGHEGHWTLIDYVADKRVATPSEAAEEAIPDIMSDVKKVTDLKNTIDFKMKSILGKRGERYRSLALMLKNNDPVGKLEKRKERLSNIRSNMTVLMDSALNRKLHRFDVLLANLNGASPTAKLVKGFGYISKDEKPVVSLSAVSPGDKINIKIHDGDMDAQVLSVRRKGEQEDG